MYDLVIVGAGPAGATLARLAGSRLRTLLVERRRGGPAEPGPRAGKCCGGLLAPEAQRALAALGLGVPREVLVGPQLFAVRAIDVASGLERHYPRHYLNVDRARFDAWLRSLVPAAVEVRTGHRLTGLCDEGDGVAAALEWAGGTEVVRARLVVGADGAASRVRARAFPRLPEPETYLAIQEWFEAGGAEPCHTAVFDPSVTDFYGWAIPKGDRIVVGAALRPGLEASGRFERLVRTLRDRGLRLGRSLGREGALLHRPCRPAHLVTGRGRVALAGEAAGFVSPSSAEGLSRALRSGAALAAALAPGLEGWAPRYRAATAGLRREILGKRLKASVLFSPTLRRAVMASGIGAVPVGEAPVQGAAVPSSG
ncbi:MAG TPA: FAD-binding protein [Anaeromyxobacteraceae bacterium]|nr:FAD-binding protein [Anaeromyxobacteraceae bacterium]